MPIESSFNYPSDLNASYPAGTDQKATADDHIRGLKSVTKTTWPNVSGAVTATHTELNRVAGVTAPIQTQLDAKAPLASPALTGTPTAPTAAAGTNTTQVATTAHVYAERTNTATLTNKTLTSPVITTPTGLVKADVGLGNVDNTSDAAKPVSTATQAALDLKANLASPALTGTPTAPTAAAGTNSTQIATTAYVQATAFSSALPAQTGNSGKFVTTDGTTASWSLVPLASSVSGTLPVANGGTGAATLTGILKGNGTSALGAAVSGTDIKTVNSTSLLGSGDVAVQATLVSGTNIKTINGSSVLGAGDLVVGGGLTLLSVVTASSSATVDIETTFDATYDRYVLIATGIRPATTSVTLTCQCKLSGAYVTTATYDYHLVTVQASSATYNGVAAQLASSIVVGDVLKTDAGHSLSFEMQIASPASTSLVKTLRWHGGTLQASGNPRMQSGIGANQGTGALTGLRFAMSSGNIASGTFRLYGIKNS